MCYFLSLDVTLPCPPALVSEMRLHARHLVLVVGIDIGVHMNYRDTANILSLAPEQKASKTYSQQSLERLQGAKSAL